MNRTILIPSLIFFLIIFLMIVYFIIGVFQFIYSDKRYTILCPVYEFIKESCYPDDENNSSTTRPNRNTKTITSAFPKKTCPQYLEHYYTNNYNLDPEKFLLKGMDTDGLNLIGEICDSGINIEKKLCNPSTYDTTKYMVPSFVKPLSNKNFRDVCCNSKDNVTSCNNFECFKNKVNHEKAKENMKVFKDNEIGFTIGNNINILKDYCTSGYNLEINKCTNSDKYFSDDLFLNYCCDQGECNESKMNCSINNILFKKSDYSMQNVNEDTMYSYINDVSNYCDIGYNINENNCKNYHPENYSQFYKFCCNSDVNTCNAKSFTCTKNTSLFKKLLNNIPPSGITSDENAIKSFCDSGNELISSNCAYQPVNTDFYRDYCCNGSTDKSDCNSSSVNCKTNFMKFSHIDNEIAEDMVYVDQENLKTYCTLGKNLLDSNCVNSPMNFEKFRRYCCGNSTNKQDCSSAPSECILKSKQFLNKDRTDIQNINLSQIQYNNSTIIDYCNDGYYLNDNCTNILNPKNYNKFNEFCCKDNVCDSTSLECLNLSSQFKNKLSNLPRSTNINDATEDNNLIKEFCALGKKVQDKNCDDIFPEDNPFYPLLCKDGTINPCSINSKKFIDLEQSLSGVTNYWGENLNNLNNYCTLGYSLTNDSCSSVTNIYPYNSSLFRQYCCVGTVCEPSSVCSPINKVNFADKDFIIKNDDSYWTSRPDILNGNMNKINEFCNLGYSLKDNNCFTPTEMFIKYCCGGKTDMSKCNSSKFSCIKDFVNLELNNKSIEDNKINIFEYNPFSDKTLLDNFCPTGKRLSDNECTVTALSKPNYTKYCCEGQNEISKCDTSCSKDWASLNADDILISKLVSTMSGSIYDKKIKLNEYNSSLLNGFCNTGKRLYDNNCKYTGLTKLNYINYCCGGIADNSRCNITT